ncbi:unnamed protein product, partial [Mesorhabditis spiculigera]
MIFPTVILLACASLASAELVTVISGGVNIGLPVGGLCPTGSFEALTPQGYIACYMDLKKCDLKILNPSPADQSGPSVGGECPTGYACIIGEICYSVMPTSTCVDKTTNCDLYLKNGFCRSKLYTAAQKKDSCCKTCKFDAACQDADPNCPLYEKNSKYCNGTTATEAQKVSTCRKTCGVC